MVENDCILSRRSGSIKMILSYNLSADVLVSFAVQESHYLLMLELTVSTDAHKIHLCRNYDLF